VVTNTLKIMRATMLLLATSNGVGVNVSLVGYGLPFSRYQGIYDLQPSHPPATQLLYDLGILPECDTPSAFADESEVVYLQFPDARLN
jgi:hypothetical protein